MTDAPAPVPEVVPEGKKALPFGIEPWMLAAAIGLGAGVVLGIRVGQMLRGPALPSRQPCPECAARAKNEAQAPPPVDPQGPVPAPPVGTDPTATNGSFSAQTIPSVADSSIPDE